MAKRVYVRLPASGRIMETGNPELWPEADRVPAAQAKAELKAEAIKELRKLLKPGDTVYTVLRYVSRDGMNRRIDLFIVKKNEPRCISSYAAKAMEDRLSEKGGICVGGCGMDMGFHLVYNLSYALFPKGAATGRGGKPDCDGGYALNHRWL